MNWILRKEGKWYVKHKFYNSSKKWELAEDQDILEINQQIFGDYI